MGGCYIPNEPTDMDNIHKKVTPPRLTTKTHGSKGSSITIKNDAEILSPGREDFFLQACKSNNSFD
jgi:hypothetical protein